MCIYVCAIQKHLEDQNVKNWACFSSGDVYTLWLLVQKHKTQQKQILKLLFLLSEDLRVYVKSSLWATFMFAMS